MYKTSFLELGPISSS